MTDAPDVQPPPPLTPGPEPHPGPGPADLGLVMGGGGARAAYQVGFLRCLARRFPELRIPYLTGVSAGAINAVQLANHHGTFLQAVDELSQLWGRLTVEQVFEVSGFSLARNVVRWGRQLLSGGAGPVRARGLVDTAPLHRFLTEVLHAVDGEITGIGYNLAREQLKAVAVSTASYTTGRSIVWFQGEGIEEWERPQRVSRRTTLTVDHVMASTALPLFFPAVKLGPDWYGDGGMRLTAPLSPVLHLGANRIIAVSTRYDRSSEEAEQPAVVGYPPPAQVVGVLMNSVFLDLLDTDALRMETINRLVDRLPPGSRGGLRKVKLFTLRPSRDLGALARDYEPRLPPSFRFMTRGLGTRQTRSSDALSLILFQPDYLNALMELGEEDADARCDALAEFILGEEEEGS